MQQSAPLRAFNCTLDVLCSSPKPRPRIQFYVEGNLALHNYLLAFRMFMVAADTKTRGSVSLFDIVLYVTCKSVDYMCILTAWKELIRVRSLYQQRLLWLLAIRYNVLLIQLLVELQN